MHHQPVHQQHQHLHQTSSMRSQPITPLTPQTPRHMGQDVNEIYSVPNNEKNRRITMREQEELDHLLKEMIHELESNPTQSRSSNYYSTTRRPQNLIATPSPIRSVPTQIETHVVPNSKQTTGYPGSASEVRMNVPSPILPTPPNSNPNSNSKLTTGRSISSHYPIYNSHAENNNDPGSFQRNTYKSRSFSHSPAPKPKPVILYTANPYMPLASPKSNRSTPVSIEEVYAGGIHRPAAAAAVSGSHHHQSLGSNNASFTRPQQQQHEFPRNPYSNMSTTGTTGPPTPARNQLHQQQSTPVYQTHPHHPHVSSPSHAHVLSSPSSPTTMDRGSRGVSRSITLTPTPITSPPHNIRNGNMQTMPSSPKQAPAAAAAAVNHLHQQQHQAQNHNQIYTPSSLTGVNFKGTTRIVPGAKIGDQENEKRTGVYASSYAKEKPLSRDERQELDDLINGMMEEIKYFPDYSTVRRSATMNFHPTQRSHSYTSGHTSAGGRAEPVIASVNYVPGSGGAGVAATRAAFERAAMNNTSPDPPHHFDHSNNNTIKRSPRTESKSPVRHVFPIQQQQQQQQVHPATPKSLTRFTDHPQTSFQSAYSNRSHFVPSSPHTSHGRSGSSPPLIAPLDSHHGGGVLSQAVEPLPPHLLTRPTHYNPRPDSRPFTYGVTSASPLIQRRRVHSESTAYVCENRPPNNGYTNGHARIDKHESDYNDNPYASVPASSYHHAPNLYDVPSDLYSTSRLNQEIDTISEASYSSSLYDDPSIPWLERQQIKLRAKKDSSDSLMMDQRNKSARMMSELMNKVPPAQATSEPASPIPSSPKLIMPSFNRSQQQNQQINRSRSPVFARSPTFIKSSPGTAGKEYSDGAGSQITPATVTATAAATGSKSPTNDLQTRNHPLSKSISLIPKPIASSSKSGTQYSSGSTTRLTSGAAGAASPSSSLLQRQKSDISYDRQRNNMNSISSSSRSKVSDDVIDHKASNSRSKIAKPSSATGKDDLRRGGTTSPAAYATINKTATANNANSRKK